MNPKFDKNPYMRRGPGPGKDPLPKTRIVIEIDPAKQGTALHTEGAPITIPGVIDVMIGQLVSLWNQFAKMLLEQGGLIDPKTGLPVPSAAPTPVPEPPLTTGTGDPITREEKPS